MRGLFLFLALFFVAGSLSAAAERPVTFRLLLGDEVKEIDCSKLPAEMVSMQKSVATQKQEIHRYQQLHPTNVQVEGENLLLLTWRWKLSFLQQELAILKFSDYYCMHPADIPASGQIDVEALLM